MCAEAVCKLAVGCVHWGDEDVELDSGIFIYYWKNRPCSKLTGWEQGCRKGLGPLPGRLSVWAQVFMNLAF